MRTLIATNKGDRWFFLFGFEKNELANVGVKALLSFQRDAEVLLSLSSIQLDRTVAQDLLKEICHDQEAISQ